MRWYYFPIIFIMAVIPQTSSVPAAYDTVMQFLDRRIVEARAERAAYFQPDRSSASAYEASLEPFRADLRKMIGVPAECLRQVRPELLEDRAIGEIEGIEIHLLRLRVCDGLLDFEALTGGNGPVALAISGTAGTPERVMGADGDDYHHKFGLRLAQAGYFVIAPTIITEPIGSSDINRLRNELDKRAQAVGLRLLGIEVGMMISALDYYGGAAVVYGISLGGRLSQLVGALDNRIGTVVISEYVEDQEGKMAGRDYPDAFWARANSDYVIMMGYLTRFDDVILAGLIAPRRLVVEVGRLDPRYGPTLTLWPEIAAAAPGAVLIVGDRGHETYPQTIEEVR